MFIKTLLFEDLSKGTLKNENDLVMIGEPSATWVPCYTKPISKVRPWIRISQAKNEQEQILETEQPHGPY